MYEKILFQNINIWPKMTFLLILKEIIVLATWKSRSAHVAMVELALGQHSWAKVNKLTLNHKKI